MRYVIYALFVVLPLGWLLVSTGQPAPHASCDQDYHIPTNAGARQLWSTQLGQLGFLEDEGKTYVRLTFVADPQKLRFDRDASLRVRTAFTCYAGEGPMALDAEVRFSRALRNSAELNDIMLLGDRTLYLSGAGVPAANQWTRVRIPIPRDAPVFSALHFGAGSAWAREHPGTEIRMDLRSIKLIRSRPTHLRKAQKFSADIRWVDPDEPEKADPRPSLVLAPGAPVYAVLDIPSGGDPSSWSPWERWGAKTGHLEIRMPPGFKARTWIADWIEMEQKVGVTAQSPIRLLDYKGDKVADGGQAHPHRFWIRLQTESPAPLKGEIQVLWKGQSVTRAVEVLPVRIPEGKTSFQMYYQNNEGWAGYAKYADYYVNAAGHFAQLRDLGFTGIHIANEPKIRIAGARIETDFHKHGRYWQRWPNTLGDLLVAAREAGFRDAPVWEGLRIFRREEVWQSLQTACTFGPKLSPQVRLTALAAAILPLWNENYGAQPVLAVDDEPGVESKEALVVLAGELARLREAGYRTYLTTHARQYDSFHQLAPLLDINALHAEDVTAGSALTAERFGGDLWLYNGGSMNIARPQADRFFYGIYGWRAGARGLTQWIYTRPSNLQNPLDLRTRLQADAQFYALPGEGKEAAATPGLLGLAAGIADRRILDYAEGVAPEKPAVAKLLSDWKEALPLPQKPIECTPYRLQKKVALHALRDELLRALSARH